MPKYLDAEKVIAEVQRYPVLYDVSHEKYRHPEYKENIWKKIANDLGFHGANGMATCKTKWTHVRDQFRKTLRKRKLGIGSTFTRKYKYEDLMQFLLPHLAERDGVFLHDCEVEEPDEEEQDKGSYYDQDCWGPEVPKIEYDTDSVSSVSKQQPIEFTSPASSRKRKASTSSDCPSGELFAQLFGKFEKRKLLPENLHPVDAFLIGISPTMKSLNPVLQNKAKSKIFSIVQELELEQLKNDGLVEGEPRCVFDKTDFN